MFLGMRLKVKYFKSKKKKGCKSRLEVWSPSIPVLTLQQSYDNTVHVSQKHVAKAGAEQPALMRKSSGLEVPRVK